MLTQKVFADALRGDRSGLVEAAGPDAVVLVEAELGSAVVVTDEVVLARRTDDGGVELKTLTFPDGFRVRKVTTDDDRLVLHGFDTRHVIGTPAELAEDDLAGHLFDAYEDMVKADLALSEQYVPEIARVGEAVVPIGDEYVWVSFDHAEPAGIVELVPQARTVLTSFERHGRAGAEYLLTRMLESDEDPDEDEDEDEHEDDGEFEEFDPEAFLAAVEPTGLVIHEGGEFSVHYESASDGTYFLDNYWPSVRFTRDGTAVDLTIEA